MSLDVKIKYIRDIKSIKQINIGNWVDLRCGETTTLKKGEFAYIPLGVAMELPKACEALVVPRSSTFKKYGVIMVNSIGVIDESYCGDNDEWHMPVLAVRDTVIPKNHRICQFRLMPRQTKLNFVVKKVLGNDDRGGLGSTGKDEFVKDVHTSDVASMYPMCPNVNKVAPQKFVDFINKRFGVNEFYDSTKGLPDIELPKEFKVLEDMDVNSMYPDKPMVLCEIAKQCSIKVINELYGADTKK